MIDIHFSASVPLGYGACPHPGAFPPPPSPSPICFLYTFWFLIIRCLFHSQPFFSPVRRTGGDRHLSNASLIQASSSLLFLSFIVSLCLVFVSTTFPSFRHDLAFSPPLFHPSPLFPHLSLFQPPRRFHPPPPSVLLPSPLARLALSPAPALHIPCPFFLFPHLRPGTFRCRWIPKTPGCWE